LALNNNCRLTLLQLISLFLLCLQVDVASSKFLSARPGLISSVSFRQNRRQQQQQVEVTTKSEAPSTIDHGQRQIDWVRSQGGFVSPKFDIREIKDDTEGRGYGVFAKEDIEARELILAIPRSCVMDNETLMEAKDNNDDNASAAEEEDGGGAMECAAARNLHREMKLGNASRFEPYITFLLETQPPGKLPSMWSDKRKSLLWEIVGGDSEENEESLPPDGLMDWIAQEWLIHCQGNPEDVDEHHAALLMVHRAVLGDESMVPLLDMMNHHNSARFLNTITGSLFAGDGTDDVQVRASRKILAGEMLYTTYDQCSDCQKQMSSYGTPEILRDYGFIESYPQKFIFAPQQVAFTLDLVLQNSDDDEDTNTGDDNVVSIPFSGEEDVDDEGFHLKLTWISEPADATDLPFFEDELESLDNLQELFMVDNADVSDREWNVLVAFYDSMYIALYSVVDILQRNNNQDCTAGGENNDKGNCLLESSQRYDPLDTLVPELMFNDEACDRSESMAFPDFQNVEKIQSQYQKISFEHNPKDNDVCFDLDGIVQICADYRPHYHEMMVHYTARYLTDIKRILWVGGGDSMLLYEFLKYYPTLEFVIGLELDQKVTRHSFKHFGTQPHWDNEKVQWWFGDAAKSMLMLPKEYFGTFDLVLVDLSETVMSMSVTKGLDILGALSLLLKPDGIFVKNEMYLENLASIFKHTIQLHYYDVPVLCSQCMCMGSNSIDFVHGDIRDHKIDPILNNLKKIDDEHYEVINDYVKNETAQRYCKGDDEENEPTEQEVSPGILMILEAEDATGELDSAASVTSAVTAALEEHGITILSTTTSLQSVGSILTFVFGEGYVVARTWPEHKYCAFDIYLWSNFENMDGVKHSLLASVGSPAHSSSSFRIVAGGMFSVPNWMQDQMALGPRFTQDCDNETPDTTLLRDVPMDEKLIDEIVEETMSLLPWKGVTAVVICGPSIDVDRCRSLYSVTNTGLASRIIAVHTCANIEGGVEFKQEAEELMVSCEKEILESIKNQLGPKNKIELIVLDPSASFETAQIFHNIASKPRTKKLLFKVDLMAIAPVPDSVERWRSVFVDKFRLIFYKEPAWRAEVLFNSTKSSVEINTFLSGDDRFLLNLDEVNQKIEKRSGLVADIREVHEGASTFHEDFRASQYSLPPDYDQSGPYKQWSSQQPTGLQTMLQMMGGRDLSSEKAKQILQDSLSEMKVELTQPIQEFTGIGDGSVVIGTWSGGNAILLWDGREHVGINLFTYDEDVAFASGVAQEITKSDRFLQVALRDEMPRGYGRVVNSKKDLGEEPYWAAHLVK